MAKYLKLGDGAHTFYDPSTGVGLSNKQVIRLQKDSDINKPGIKAALRTGHLVMATKEDWEASKKLHGEQAEESKKNLKVITKTTVTTMGGNATSEPSLHTPDAEDGGEGIEDEDDGDEENEDDLSKSDLIDKIKEHGSLNKQEKKDLLTKTEEELRDIWNSLGKP